MKTLTNEPEDTNDIIAIYYAAYHEVWDEWHSGSTKSKDRKFGLDNKSVSRFVRVDKIRSNYSTRTLSFPHVDGEVLSVCSVSIPCREMRVLIDSMSVIELFGFDEPATVAKKENKSWSRTFYLPIEYEVIINNNAVLDEFMRTAIAITALPYNVRFVNLVENVFLINGSKITGSAVVSVSQSLPFVDSSEPWMGRFEYVVYRDGRVQLDLI